jgi:hypothetical protein
MRYAALALIALLLALAGFFAGCHRPRHPPSDFHAETLDARSTVLTADSIVLGYPVNRKVIRELFLTQVDAEPLPYLETETTLVVLGVFKGPPLPKEIRFRHYDEDHRYVGVIGPPQGPSGRMGDRGIFFLRRQSTSMFRSIVDVFRPDISTPWIGGTADAGPCANAPAECISTFLLTFRPGYDQKRFISELRLNVRISWRLVAPMDLFELLNKLAEEADPDDVKRGACRELSEWYDVFPQRCRLLMAGSPAEQVYLNRAILLREHLRHGGTAWVLARLHTKDEGEALRYLQYLSQSSDAETRRITRSLLASQKTVPKPP